MSISYQGREYDLFIHDGIASLIEIQSNAFVGRLITMFPVIDLHDAKETAIRFLKGEEI